jgi:hypothetical protein
MGAGALGSAAGTLYGSPHPLIASFVICGIVYGLLPLIFPSMRNSLRYGLRPFKKHPLSEERVLDREDLIRVLEHRRVLAKIRR